MATQTSTWILVANRVGADIYAHRGTGKDLSLVEHIDHPRGRLKNSEIDTDRPGTGFASHGTGSDAKRSEQDSHDHVATTFAKQLADLMNKGRTQASFDQLILVAEPRFLGMLRQALDETTHRLVTASIGKDIVGAKQEILASYLSPHLSPHLAG